MRAYTLRGIDDKLYRIIRQESRHAGKSMNRHMLDIIAGGTGGGEKAPVPKKDIDRLFGCLSKADSNYYGQMLAEQRKIDREMWR